jgi:hypothetical protein
MIRSAMARFVNQTTTFITEQIPLRFPQTHTKEKNCAQRVPKNIKDYRKLSKNI